MSNSKPTCTKGNHPKNILWSKHSICDEARHTHTITVSHYEGIKKTTGHDFMLFLKTCKLVTLDRIALTLFITKRGTKLGGCASSSSSQIQKTNQQQQQKQKQIYSFHSSLEIEHAGQNRGWTSRVSQPPHLTTGHFYSDRLALITPHRLGLHTRERSHC